MELREKVMFIIGFAALLVLAIGSFYGLIVNMEIGMLIMVCSLLFMPIILVVDSFLEERERESDE